MRREIQYIRPDALAVNGSNFPLPLCAVYKEHVGVYMSPVFGNGVARNRGGRGILCEQESKLTETLLNRH